MEISEGEGVDIDGRGGSQQSTCPSYTGARPFHVPEAWKGGE